MGTTETANQRLASLLLERPVMDWIADQRTAGRSWLTIANDLRTATDGQVDISHEAVRLWAEQTTVPS